MSLFNFHSCHSFYCKDLLSFFLSFFFYAIFYFLLIFYSLYYYKRKIFLLLLLLLLLLIINEICIFIDIYIYIFIYQVGFASFRGKMDVITPLKISLLANAVNAILDPIMIFGCNMGILFI